jgi:hypothetical protein
MPPTGAPRPTHGTLPVARVEPDLRFARFRAFAGTSVNRGPEVTVIVTLGPKFTDVPTNAAKRTSPLVRVPGELRLPTREMLVAG